MRQADIDELVSNDAFQSTHPLRGATQSFSHSLGGVGISIYAPLAGCDKKLENTGQTVIYFNLRTPCGVRLEIAPFIEEFNKFQSTHPLRGATGTTGGVPEPV